MNKSLYKYLPFVISCLYPSIAMANTGDMGCIGLFIIPPFIFLVLLATFIFTCIPYFHIKSHITQNKQPTNLFGCKSSMYLGLTVNIICSLATIFMFALASECEKYIFEDDSILFSIILTAVNIINLVIQFILFIKSMKMISNSKLITH